MHSLAILTQLKNEEKETQTDDTTNDIIPTCT